MLIALALTKVVIAWALLWLIFTGCGMWIRQAFGARGLDVEDLLLAPWLGWAGVIGLLQLWHLWLPVNGYALLVVAAIGASGLLLHARPLVVLVTAGNGSSGGSGDVSHAMRGLAALAVALLGAVWLANQTVRQPQIYDSGLYHLNAIRWAREYPIVPGLGNLHARLAYNNSSFLYTAMLDVWPFRHRSHQLASGFLMWLMMLQCGRSLVRMAGLRTGVHPADLFLGLFAVSLLTWIVSWPYPSSPSPDVPCFLLAVLVVAELMRFLSRPRRESFACIGLLALTGITVKLSLATFGAVALAVVAGGYLWSRATRKGFIRVAGILAGLGLVVILPWCARGVLLSGYPAYPSTLGGMTVTWALPAEALRQDALCIKAFARVPYVPQDTVLHTWSWLRPWARRMLEFHRLDIVLPAVAGAVALGLLAWRRQGTWPGSGRYGLALLPPLVGDLVWFVAAPEPRLQGAQFWALGNGLLALALPAGRGVRIGVVILHAAVVLALCASPLSFVCTEKDPGPAKRVSMKTVYSESGLGVLIPASGERPWASDLPASVACDPKLRLRVPGDLAGGFTR